MKSKGYVLTHCIVSHLAKGCRFWDIRCYRCGKVLNIGDIVVCRCVSSRVNLYHTDCYESLFIVAV